MTLDAYDYIHDKAATKKLSITASKKFQSSGFKMNTPSSFQVAINDPFWSSRLETNANKAIFHQWQQLEASSCIENFRIAAGESNSFRQGWYFADSDAYKWLDAAACILASHPSSELSDLVESLIGLLARAQTNDGYLFTYNQVFFPGQRWVDLQIEHELYCLGHLIEAGVSHFEATHKNNLLTAAIKAADLLVQDFLNKSPDHTCGHEEIEIALLRLYRVAEKQSYLDLAQQFIERRGRISLFPLKLLRQYLHSNQRKAQVAALYQRGLANNPQYQSIHLPPENPHKKPPFLTMRWYLNGLSGKFAQQHLPIHKLIVPVGHSVRFGYLETAAAMLHRLRPDESLLAAMKIAWEHMVTRRMYVTGGLGSVPKVEGFGKDYELDPEYAYAETCAALASMFWSWEMALITGEAQYSDLFEWQLYNAAAVGFGLDGKSYLFNNPLLSRGGISRLPWFEVPCCPPNLARTWAALGKYLYSYNEHEIWLHQYISSQVCLPTQPGFALKIESKLPYSGKVIIRLNPITPAAFTIHLRLPSWCNLIEGRTITNLNSEPRGIHILLNGKNCQLPPQPRVSGAPASGYDPRTSQFLSLERTWSAGDIIELDMEMPILLRRAHPKVKGHRGKVALTRGPLVYCLESIDNPNLDIIKAHISPQTLITEFDPNILGGIWVLRGLTTTDQPFTAIPYSLWANRGKSQMTVWVNITE